MSVRNLLLASAAVSLLAIPAASSAGESRPLLLAQAEGEVLPEIITDPVLLAEQAVEEARAALRAAMASGRGIAQARQNLRDAIRVLEEAREAAGLPAEESDDVIEEPLVIEEPPVVEEPPPVVEEPAVVEELPPVVEEPLVIDEPPLVIEEPPLVIEEPPPPPVIEDQPPLVIEEPPVAVPDAPPVVEPPPVIEETPPLVVEEPPPPIEPPEVEPPAVEPPPATEPAPTAADVPPAVVELPPVVVDDPPPPPPPAATEGEFDLQEFTERPNFGEAPTTPEAAPPLPQAAEAVKEGETLAAPDGRIIVKNQGQVTIVHDDTGRFVRRGDRTRTDRTANETQTITVTRPDGTEIVTVRDRWGNIIQRYRKNPNGSVEILIGQMEQPGLVGRLFGQGAQPAPPPPAQPPASLNLQFGPLVLSIPQQQYIVESSRADRQQLQQALVAPPVETVERAYTLEEINRSGRLRDKVRRIDLDTITFNTNQATVPDSQIVQMQAIGMAIRDLVQQDPTQVILVEGHTDAVGSDLYNLALSDRRAQTIAQILSYYFGIPPENLVTQGYGEQYLKIPTAAAERQNRRVAFRNITYLLRAGG